MIDFEFEFQYAEEKQPTLQKVGGSIPAGRCVVLCGGSGCGKSTLLRCINGLIPQFYEGELRGFCRLNGQDTAGLRIGEIGELAASVFQDPRSQFFTVNSSNEVAFGLENHGLPQDKIRRRVDEAFWIFHLERLKDRNVYELSSGERQLISILSAWAMDTDIFLLDEPTANLDFAATQQLKEILLALKKQGKTLLLSEHRLYYLADIADEFWVMADGEIKGNTLPQRQRRSQWSGDKHFLCARSTLRRSPCRRKSRCRKPRRRRLPSQMSAIHMAGRLEIPSLVSVFPSVSMRSSVSWAQTAAAKRPSAS